MRSRHCAAECRLDRWSSCIRSMSDLGQTEKNSVRAHVFRFALQLGHCSTQSDVSFVPKAEVGSASYWSRRGSLDKRKPDPK
jgi:hypothetical protein